MKTYIINWTDDSETEIKAAGYTQREGIIKFFDENNKDIYIASIVNLYCVKIG
jgi:hypothetical protein